MDDPLTYRSTIGALQYLVLTLPEIAYAVSKASQFLQSPTERHWIADWAGCPDDRKSTTGYCLYR